MQDLHPPWTLFESVASTCWANGSDSPCLLVKGADCAGVCLAVLAWLCPGLSRDARSRVARIELWPRQSRMTAGSNGERHRILRRGFPGMLSPASPGGGGFRHAIIPRANRAGGGVASGATKLVPAILSGLAQRGEQCPSLIGKPWGFFTIRLGRPLWLPLRLVLRTKRCALP